MKKLEYGINKKDICHLMLQINFMRCLDCGD